MRGVLGVRDLAQVTNTRASVAAFGNWQPGCIKHLDDLMRYRLLIDATQPEVVIECGTHTGGSAKWFASQGPEVVTVDIAPREQPARDGVTYVVGNSINSRTYQHVAMLTAGRRTMVSLDSDHSALHVFTEIQLYAPLVSPGCYLVVEDGILPYLPAEVQQQHGLGIYVGSVHQGIQAALDRGALADFDWDKTLEALTPVTMHPWGWWQRHA